MDYNSFLETIDIDEDLRPYQNDNKSKIYESWKTNRSVMLQMPTGTGKTRLFVSILRDFHKHALKIKKQVRALVLVHRVELIDQISDELGARYGLAHGFIHAQDRERRKFPFHIASVQTLNKRLDNWSDYNFDFIIVDEAHHVLADSYKKIIKTFPEAKVLGVTATPYRLSGAGFKPEFDVLIESDPIKSFINNGYLSKFEYYSIPAYSYMQNQIDNISSVDASGDYSNAEMMATCDKDKIRAQIVETYLKYANGKKGIVYTINKKHNQHLCEAFCEKGINAVAIDSDTDAEKREQLIENFRNGKITVLCNVDIFSEGFDCPDIEFVQLARPTKSLSLFLQQVGRGLRMSENKEKTIFLDNVGLYNRFGLPDTKRQWMDYFNGIEGVIEQKETKNTERVRKFSRRERDLSEGSESVHLIHSSLDEEYLYDRAIAVYDAYLLLYATYWYSIFSFNCECEKDNGFKIKNYDFWIKKMSIDIIDCENGEIKKELDDLLGGSIYSILEIEYNNEYNEEKHFNSDVKNETIDSFEKYENYVKNKFDKFIGKFLKGKIIRNYKSNLQNLKKHRIGKEERNILIHQIIQSIFVQQLIKVKRPSIFLGGDDISFNYSSKNEIVINIKENTAIKKFFSFVLNPERKKEGLFTKEELENYNKNIVLLENYINANPNNAYCEFVKRYLPFLKSL